MGQFRYLDFDYSNVSLAEGFEQWKKNEGWITSIAKFSYRCRGNTVAGSHWSGEWRDTEGMGNCGRHYIVPVSPEAEQMILDYFCQKGTPLMAYCVDDNCKCEHKNGVQAAEIGLNRPGYQYDVF